MVFAQGAEIICLQSRFTRVELARFVGIPQMIVVGLPAKAGTAAKERLVAILKTVGVRLPHCRFVFNLFPALPTQVGQSLDLAMMVTVLASLGILRKDIILSDYHLWLGELRLDGTVAPPFGLPVILEAATKLGYREVWCSDQCRDQLAIFKYDLVIHTIHSVVELISPAAVRTEKLTSKAESVIHTSRAQSTHLTASSTPQPDWQILLSQPLLEKAMLVAAAGWHHTVLIGPPGLGKTTIAALLIELLPSLQPTEQAEVARIRSLSQITQIVTSARCCMQATAQTTMTDLLGSVKQNSLGLVSRAHCGVLFFDELLHLPGKLLDALRDPLETGAVMLPNSMLRFPAQFLFIGVTNPCQCGNAFSQYARCRCGSSSTIPLQRKLDASWLDRIGLSMYIDYQPAQWHNQPLSKTEVNQKITRLKTVIRSVWKLQEQRWGAGIHNGMVRGVDQIAQLQLTSDAQTLVLKTKQQQLLSERGCNSVLLVASTIADIESIAQHQSITPIIEAKHIAEALQFRFRLLSS